MPPRSSEDRGEFARKAVLKHIPKGVEPDIVEYLSSTASGQIEEEEDDADLEGVSQRLLEIVEEFLSDAKVSTKAAQEFCNKVVREAYGVPLQNEAPAAAKAAPKKGAFDPKARGKASGEGERLCYVKNLMLMYGGSPEPLLKNTTLELVRGHRYGVVGANGAGKTTLMSRIASKEIQGIPDNITCVHLRHETILDGIDMSTTCTEYARMKGGVGGKQVAITDSEAITHLNQSLKDVGFAQDMLTKAVRELSGGWRMRLALACAMAQKADVLLLDEPTNHLDVQAVKWLVGFINKTCIGGQTGGTAMIVSHDPDFLNQVCTDVVHFTTEGKLAYHPGNFDAFKQQALGGSEAEARRLLEIMKDSNIAGGANGVRMDNDEKSRISFPFPEKLEAKATAPVLKLTNASFTYDESRGPVLKDVTVRISCSSRIAVVGRNGAGKSTMMSIIAGELQPCSETGDEKDAGEMWKHKDLRVAYIAQQHMHHLSAFLSLTPKEYIQLRYRNGWDEEAQQRLTLPQNDDEREFRAEAARKYGKRGKAVEELLSRQVRNKQVMYEVKWKDLDDPKQNTYEPLSKLRLLGVERMAAALDERIACRAAGVDQRPLTQREVVNHLKEFGLTEDMTVNRKISMLSAGQKSKLMLAASFWTKPHVVLLDEPTNYLDVDTVEALARALRSFRGGCVVITHNEKFIEDVCDEIWEVADKQCKVKSKDGGPARLMKAVGGTKAASTAKAKENADRTIGIQKGVEAKAARTQEESLALFLEARKRLGPCKQDIKVQNFDMDSPDGTPLLRGTNLQLTRGRRYGFAGRNGTGKSTLLRAIAGYNLDKHFPKNIKVLLVEQEAAGDDRTALQTLLDGDLELKLLREEEKELTSKDDKDEARLKAVFERLEEIGAADAETRAMKILRGLQFDEDLLARSTRALSGGWRMRVSLGMALFAQPEILLLDEPTNHLDFPAVLWLEDYLNAYKETAVIVSHDRNFLDNVATDVIQLQAQRLNYYRGNYSAYLQQDEQQYKAQERAYKAQQMEIQKAEEQIARFDMQLPKDERAKKHTGVMAQIKQLQRQLEKMERIDHPDVTWGKAANLEIHFPPVPDKPQKALITLEEVDFGYPGKPLCKKATGQVFLDSRIGILGRNGAGKSTLLKVMCGSEKEIEAIEMKGKVTKSPMRIATFAQHHVDTLKDLNSTCVACMEEICAGMKIKITEQQCRNLLGRMGIQGEMALRRVKTLSGGQKSRVALAVAMAREPHLIVLDEPTNHLDMETIESLIEGLIKFDGAVVFVSHDQYFLEKVATELWAVAAGGLKCFRGDGKLGEAKQFTYTACGVR
mmetsp:Transcript_12694/g.28027  ORF Transcript_12694/g.28027 Transcript_12694/m.28027 type:complete len:1323 (-) Transcript_12694:333-4301(-)